MNVRQNFTDQRGRVAGPLSWSMMTQGSPAVKFRSAIVFLQPVRSDRDPGCEEGHSEALQVCIRECTIDSWKNRSDEQHLQHRNTVFILRDGFIEHIRSAAEELSPCLSQMMRLRTAVASICLSSSMRFFREVSADAADGQTGRRQHHGMCLTRCLLAHDSCDSRYPGSTANTTLRQTSDHQQQSHLFIF